MTDMPKFRLRFEVTIEKFETEGVYNAERLSTREQFDIRAEDFTEVAAILGQFHALAKRIEAERSSGNDHSRCVIGEPCKAGGLVSGTSAPGFPGADVL